jgi:hypothetical protein
MNPAIAIALTLAGVISTAGAAPNAELLRGQNMLIVRIETSTNDLLGDHGAGKGALRCRPQDKDGIAAGCYIGVTRRARLVEPEFLPRSKRDDIAPHRTVAFSPPVTGTAVVTEIAPQEQETAGLPGKMIVVTLPNAVGVGLSLYSDCNETTTLHCEDQNGESYRHGITDPVASFVVGLDGSVRAYTREVAKSVQRAALAAEAAKAQQQASMDGLMATIVHIDDTTYELPRALVDSALANSADFVAGGRVVPAMNRGQAIGYKLYAIRPHSPLAAVGFQNGDVIKSINGISLIEPNVTLTPLRSASIVRVVLERGGTQVVLTWRIK